MSKKTRFKEKIVGSTGKHAARRLAKRIDKEDFLKQVKAEWMPVLRAKGNFDIDEELKLEQNRIQTSGMQEVFDIVGVTSEDIRKVLQEIHDEVCV